MSTVGFPLFTVWDSLSRLDSSFAVGDGEKPQRDHLEYDL